MKTKIQQLSEQFHSEIISVREHIHKNPELSFQEFKTADFIEEKLKSFGLEPKRMAKTGLVALIEGKNPSKKTVALRADIDALPITEENDKPYKSQNIGIMHACGHDVHTACLLGATKILLELKEEFEGTVKLIFQLGEETTPGGASLMIKEGVLESPKVNSIIGQHVMPFIDAGKVGFKKGMYMASADEIYIKVFGKGGHGAMPDINIDPVVITAHIITALQQIVSRVANPKIPSVLSFGKVQANGATNVIPNEVYLEGTFRTLNEEWREKAHQKMKKMAEGIAESMGGSCDFNIVIGYPFLINNEQLTEILQNAAKDYLGEENVEDLDIWMAAEDFSYYTHHADACFYRLGVRNEETGITSSVHTPTFDIDPLALKTGMGLMAYLAITELNN